MPLNPDDTVCFCFHVSLRKIETFCKVEKPKHASQISECLSAGSGCGWCVPMLERIHQRVCGENQDWWRQASAPAAAPVADARTVESVDAEAYKAGRKNFIQEGKGKPPPGAPE
jgi:bacterioferritin-associated ferredoxin